MNAMRITILSLFLFGALLTPLHCHTNVLNVVSYGARAGDQVDDTAAFQSALNAARTAGKTVYVPAGSYWFTSHLTIPSGVTLTGTLEGPFWGGGGSLLNATEGSGNENGSPFITLEAGAGIKGLSISYPNQNPQASTPTPYPWTIQGMGAGCRLENLLIMRPYKMIDFATNPCPKHYINKINASPLKTGISIDGSTGGRVNNVHFTTFAIGQPLIDWRLVNGESFIVARADSQSFTNCFSLWCSVGFRIKSGLGGNGKLSGPAQNLTISSSGIDCSITPMIVESCRNLTVNECVFKGQKSKIQTANSYPVVFSQCNFSPIDGTTSLVEARGYGCVSFVQCKFEYWDTGGTLAPALDAICSALRVIGCEFGDNNRAAYFIGSTQKCQIRISSAVQDAVISENRFRYGQSIINNAGSAPVFTNNVTDDVDAP